MVNLHCIEHSLLNGLANISKVDSYPFSICLGLLEVGFSWVILSC